MNLQHLRYFIELANTQHYTRAAEHLCITQPSLSHAIAQLEAELGVPLFEKQGRGTVLTQYGQQFLLCAQQTITALDEGVSELQRVSRGEGLIRLGLLRPLGVEFVPALASHFLQENPDKNIHFTFQSGSTGMLLQLLSERKLDLVFASRPPEDPALHCAPVGHQDLVLIVPKGHPLSGRPSIDLAETLSYPQIFFSEDAGLRHIINGLFAKTGGAPHIAYETQEDQVIAGLVAHGFGIAVVPDMKLLRQLNLDIIQITKPAWERKFYLIRDSRTYQSPAAQRFWSFVLSQAAQ